MPLLSDLDSIDLAILVAVADMPGISTREIEQIVYLSRTHVLRRLRQLEEKRLIVFEDGTPGLPYRYMLDPDVTPEEISTFTEKRSSLNSERVAREVSTIVLQGIEAISDILADMAGRIETILK